ncbi:hypothetical protein SEEB9115_03377 [Salmonella enterica subsp. enterica serovar Bareilly str. ATCC 9115]|uniref:hypothetical protein n=1 Tax=Salmonella enterica TaxID=28901 RepID=UPI0003BD1A03|nr:hypothetical protein [Salmonella enterica]EED3130724.1 hypothetical protein [Salmonella enterica subsp. enterica serovar Oslo]EHN5789142.1 hypothetical protein [Salmonella enterica]ELL1286557.1 hypothetical protein [Salmonella enterica]ELN0442722.1 hypothetical protein [Salmonella enterica]ESH39050.1 hypothetical protein SEEB9115_03377 [Salmonella enterica subsp. enterica serovar Bareilly str. ATCC 9115]
MDESRKQFESVIGGKCWSVQKTDSGSYVHERVHLMWMAWRESRAAIEIELPAINDISSDDYSIPDLVDWDDGRNAGIQECAEAIRAAGIKVKE